MSKVDRDYLGVEELVEEQLLEAQEEVLKVIKRGEQVRFTTETPGWVQVIKPFLERLTAMPAVDPSKEGWERAYLANYALITTATKILATINSWVAQADDVKEEQDAEAGK